VLYEDQEMTFGGLPKLADFVAKVGWQPVSTDFCNKIDPKRTSSFCLTLQFPRWLPALGAWRFKEDLLHTIVA
jgi:hypothetical protein